MRDPEHAGGQISGDQLPLRSSDPDSRSSDPDSTAGRWARVGDRLALSWILIGLLVCAVLGILSVLTLPSLPGYDAFAWVVWGRELAHHIIGPSQSFVPRGGPSWKPLPVLLTTGFGFFHAAPALWLAFARAAGLFGLLVAYRLGSRLAASRRWCLAGPIAGVLAAFAVFLTSGWTHYMFRGTSEPMVVSTTLFAIERHLAGRRIAAFLSGVTLVLLRPEAGVLVGLYAPWLFFADRSLRTRAVLLAGLLAIPVAWFVPTWIASGQPLLASVHARDFNGHLGDEPALEVLKRATNLTVWPVIVAALAATLLAIRTREWVTVTLAGAGLAYLAVVEVMTLAHYPGLERFMLPAAAVACVLAGVAVARFATLAGGGLVSLAIAVMAVAIAVPFFDGRVAEAATEERTAQRAVAIYDQLVAAVHRVGGTGRVFPCPTSHAAVNHTMQTSLAWALNVPLTRVLGVTDVASSLRKPALAFFAPRNRINGGAPKSLVGGLRGTRVARAGVWRVYRVTRTGDRAANACVG